MPNDDDATRFVTSVFDTGRDWELRVDLDRKLAFQDIVETTLRPDLVLWSKQAKTVVALELTDGGKTVMRYTRK